MVESLGQVRSSIHRNTPLEENGKHQTSDYRNIRLFKHRGYDFIDLAILLNKPCIAYGVGGAHLVLRE